MTRRLKTILIVGGTALVLALFVPNEAKGPLLSVLAPIFTIGLIIAVGVYIVSAGVRSGMEKPQPRATAPQPLRHPGVRVLSMPDGYGRFRVSGVDRETRMDTVWYCSADSEANARAKGELEGIVVTSVERM